MSLRAYWGLSSALCKDGVGGWIAAYGWTRWNEAIRDFRPCD